MQPQEESRGMIPIIPNYLYRVPFFYLFLECVLCYCSFIFVVSVPVRELLCCFPVVKVLACAVRWVSSELSRCFLGSVLQIGSQMFP